ncbi:MAG: Hint domain-containing protein, partial [Bacteroidota bacterium]
VNGREKALLHLEDTRGKQKFQLGEELQSKSGDLVLRFEIVDVYPGAKYQDTGFAELEFDGTGVLCLGAGTPILLADGGLKAIEEITPGDQVLSWDEGRQELRASMVERIGQQRHDNLVRLEWESGSLLITDDHPIFVVDKGWAVANPAGAFPYQGFERLAKLAPGDLLLLADGKSVPLQAITPINQSQLTYTITRLSHGNNFIANGVRVGVEEIPLLP